MAPRRLADALESGVNLVAALVALWALRLAAQPPDPVHQFGHGQERVPVEEHGAAGLVPRTGKEDRMGIVWTVLAIIGLIVVLQAIF